MLSQEREKQIQLAFEASYPLSVDFTEAEYRAHADRFDELAGAAGYALAGIRLKRAVFSTKGVQRG